MGTLTWFNVATLLSVVLAPSNGFLLDHQRELEELNRQTIELLSWTHSSNSELHRAFIASDILVYLGNATVQLQSVNEDVTHQMKEFRSAPDADHTCLDTIDASIYDEVLTGQLWLQLCVTGVDFFLTRDAAIRFQPVATRVHRDATEMVRTAVETLGEINPVRDGEQVREQLVKMVDHFDGIWTRAQHDLSVELEKHEDLREEVIGSFHGCVEDLYFYFEVQLYNLLWFARDTCL